MKYSYYQLNNHSFRYTRNWYEHQGGRRVYRTVQYRWTGDCMRQVFKPTIGFRTGYEYGYSLGMF